MQWVCGANLGIVLNILISFHYSNVLFSCVLIFKLYSINISGKNIIGPVQIKKNEMYFTEEMLRVCKFLPSILIISIRFCIILYCFGPRIENMGFEVFPSLLQLML